MSGDNKEAIAIVLSEEKQRQFGETLSVLDSLRRTRAERGGTGAPLIVPKDLANPIIITDADIKLPDD